MEINSGFDESFHFEQINEMKSGLHLKNISLPFPDISGAST